MAILPAGRSGAAPRRAYDAGVCGRGERSRHASVQCRTFPAVTYLKASQLNGPVLCTSPGRSRRPYQWGAAHVPHRRFSNGMVATALCVPLILAVSLRSFLCVSVDRPTWTLDNISSGPAPPYSADAASAGSVHGGNIRKHIGELGPATRGAAATCEPLLGGRF